MNHYAMNDFVGYFGRSWFLHPKTGAVVRVVEVDVNLPNSHVLVQRAGMPGNESVSLEELDWKHMAVPQLGYRSFGKGRRLYYLVRSAGRRTAKGVTPDSIKIKVPPAVGAIAAHLGDESMYEGAQLDNLELLEELFSPHFTYLPEAVQLLKDDPQALGFALSPTWAVTLGPYKAKPFLLHYKESPVGDSTDGKDWKFINDTAKELFFRSSIRG